MQTIPSTAAICLLIALLCAACSTDAGPITPTPSHIAPPTATTAPPATQTPPPQPTASPTRPAPTETDDLPTETAPATAIPGEWRVPVAGISEWGPQVYGSLAWAGPDRLSYEGQDHRIHLVSAETGGEVAMMKPTPDPFFSGANVSAAQEYHILCRPDGLQMIHTADQRVIATSALPVQYCDLVVWDSNGQAAVILTDDGEVYLWLTDGSAPHKLGQAYSGYYPAWSPDDTQILLVDDFEGNLEPYLSSFSIAYRDGRPMFKPNTPMDLSNNWQELEWVTNTIIRNRIHGNAYAYYDYFDARTGRFIIRNSFSDSGGRPASLSPNGRWLVLEAAPMDTIWETRWDWSPSTGTEQTLPGIMVVNLDTLRRSLVTQSLLPPERQNYYGDSLKFLGWKADSSRFYFIHFPNSYRPYDLPTGLLAMNPINGYIESVLSDVAYGLPSPDGEHVFLVTAEIIEDEHADRLTAGIYTLDGAPVTALQPVSGPVEYYSSLNEVDVYASEATKLLPSQWSPDGSRLVYSDTYRNLWVMDTAGNTTQLAANLPKESLDERPSFSWSPDGQYLLIKGRQYAWIALLPTLTP